LHHYPERLALLQLATPDGAVWLVDTLALPDLAPLEPVFASPGTTVVLHAGDNDLAHLKRRHGLRFESVFDTSIAARFLGAAATGLEVLLAGHLAVTLPPSRQKDDWSSRPLSDAQRHYAAADVFHLSALRRTLAEALAGSGRLAWVEEECAALAAQAVLERAPDPNAFASLRGARDLSARGLAMLRELHSARERLALTLDRPPFKIVADETLVRIAQAAPADAAALAHIQGCTPKVVARWGGAFLEAVTLGQALPEDVLPRLESRPRLRIPGGASRRIEALRRWRGEAAPRVGLDPGLLLPNRLITAIALAGPRDVDALAALDGVRRWRAEAFGDEIVAVVRAT